MSLYADFINSGLTDTQIGDLRAVIHKSHELPSSLQVKLVDGEFHFYDSLGSLGSTRLLDVALTLIAAGQNARELLGLNSPGTYEVVKEYEPPEEATPPIDPARQERARQLARSMQDRRFSAGGEPPDHTGEGAPIATLGEGDGPIK